MELPSNTGNQPETVLPDWNEKIKFNNLSKDAKRRLENGHFQLYSLNDYLANNGDFLADSLRDKMNEIYSQEKDKFNGDDLFWAIVNYASPKAQYMYQTSVIVIMSKYFETCDIFEEPPQKEAK